MRLLTKNLSSFFLLIFLTGCGISNSSVSKEEGICYSTPEWINKTYVSKNKIYGVGVAGENINGFSAQRKSAISRAINEIASQLKVKVNNRFVSITDSRSGSAAQSYTFQTVDNQIVHAKIIKSCKNPNNGMFYVLMESDKK